MNVLDTISQELQSKGSLTKDEIKRFIYLRTCQLFSYDSRYHYVDFLGTYGKQLQQEILNREVDLENVTDFSVCCSSYSKAYKKIVKELLNEEVQIMTGGHSYGIVSSAWGDLRVDATMGDLTRAKIGVETTGYRPIKKNPTFKTDLKWIDHKLDYIKYVYPSIICLLLEGPSAKNSFLAFESNNPLPENEEEKERFIYDYLISSMKIAEEELEKFMSKEMINNKELQLLMRVRQIRKYIYESYLSEDELVLLEKIGRIKNIFNTSYRVTSFEDAKFIVEYFFSKVLTNSETINGIYLFQNNDDGEWEFINIYPVYFENYCVYFKLSKQGEFYIFDEIPYNEARSLVNHHNGSNRKSLHSIRQ